MTNDATNAIHVKPAPGKRVRDPGAAYGLLPPEGRLVRPSQYWTRRQQAGEVIVTPARPAQGV